jgi:hypothetical protein
MSNVLPINPETTVSNAALVYMLRHRAEHLSHEQGTEALKTRCATHLMLTFDIGQDRAQREAALALAQASHSGDVWLDISNASAYHVTLRTKDHREIIVSADQILHAVTDFFSLK